MILINRGEANIVGSRALVRAEYSALAMAMREMLEDNGLTKENAQKVLLKDTIVGILCDDDSTRGKLREKNELAKRLSAEIISSLKEETYVVKKES